MLNVQSPAKESITLQTAHLKLRVLQAADVTEAYIQGLNDPEVNRYLLVVKQTQQTRASVESYVEENRKRPGTYFFGLFMSEGKKLIGTLRLADISAYHWSAGIGICLFAKESWGKGYAAEALQAVVTFAFEEVGLHYLEAGCYEENVSSANLFKKVGFTQRAIVTDKYRFEDRFVNVLFFGKTNPHFELSKLKS